MTANPEQPVLDEIDRLVDWQLEEGRRRGDGPRAYATVHPDALRCPAWRDIAAMPGFAPSPRMRLWSEDGRLIADTARGDRIAPNLEESPPDHALVALQCFQPSCDWSLPIEWREPGHGILGPVRRMTPERVEAWLGEHCERAHGIPVTPGDSRSAPFLDTIDTATGEQPRH